MELKKIRKDKKPQKDMKGEISLTLKKIFN